MAQITLRPNGVGTFGVLTPVGAATFWETIDETSSDGDTTYSTSVLADEFSSATVQAHGLSSVTINSCTFYATLRTVTGTTDVLWGGSDSGGGDQGLTTTTVNSTYTEYSAVFTLHPATGMPYTLSNLNSLQLLAYMFTGTTRVTQMYVVVDYTVNTATPTNILFFAGD